MAESREPAVQTREFAKSAGFSAVPDDVLRLSVRLIDWPFGRCADPPLVRSLFYSLLGYFPLRFLVIGKGSNLTNSSRP